MNPYLMDAPREFMRGPQRFRMGGNTPPMQVPLLNTGGSLPPLRAHNFMLGGPSQQFQAPQFQTGGNGQAFPMQGWVTGGNTPPQFMGPQSSLGRWFNAYRMGAYR